MSFELIKRVTIKADGVYFYSKSNNDDLNYREWRCGTISEVYEVEGQTGLDREVIRMLCEYAQPTKIGAKYHKSIEPYACAIFGEEGNALLEKRMKDKEARFSQLSEEDKACVNNWCTINEEERTDGAKQFIAYCHELTERLYTDMAKLVQKMRRALEKNDMDSTKEKKDRPTKLSEEDKTMLTEMGCLEEDFKQIEDSMKSRNTQYKVFGPGCSIPIVITRETAIRILGRRKWLSGLARSAFHYTAVRDSDDGRKVFFDSSRMHRG